MEKDLVLAGGGHAHMVSLANLHRFAEKGYRVTVVGPSEYHYYSGMGPGMLGKKYKPEEIRFATRHVVNKKGGNFVLGKVAKIDPAAQIVYLESGDSLSYDVLSCNLGSQVPEDIVSEGLEDIYLVKPIERLLVAQERILELGSKKEIAIGVVGGGPSALEISGNIWRLTQEPGMKPVGIKIMTSERLMLHYPDGIRRKALASLKGRGIEILEDCNIQEIKTGRVMDVSGNVHNLDIIFVAVGIRPSKIFRESGIPTGPDGGMLVNRYLQSTEYSNVFGGGDCIYFEDCPLDKVGVYAVRQNPILYQNLMAMLEGSALKAFDPGGEYLLIFNLGDGTGIFYKWRIQFGGALAFRIKDYIDRRFMRQFQAIE
jgi:NADH dehydrogenase FAD-containing subunit